MSTKHTPEPWSVETLSVYDPGHQASKELSLVIVNLEDPRNTEDRKHVIAEIAMLKNVDPIDQANAARIVACVNACAGIYDPKELIQASEFALRERDELKEQRDFNFQQWQEISNLATQFKKQRDSLLELIKGIADMKPRTFANKTVCFDLAKSAVVEALDNLEWLQPGEQAPEHSDELPFTTKPKPSKKTTITVDEGKPSTRS